MQDIQNAVADAIKNITTSGIIEKAIEKQLEKTIGDIVMGELREYSDFGKVIKAKVQEALIIDPDKLSFPVYNEYITEMLKRRVAAYMNEQGQAAVETMMEKLLVAPPKSITFDQLLADFTEQTHNDDYDDGNSGKKFSLEIKDDGQGFIYVSLSKGERESWRSSYTHDYQIAIHKDEVFKITFGDTEIKKDLFSGPFYNFDRTLFQLYVAKTKITFPNGTDAGNYETYYPGGDD